MREPLVLDYADLMGKTVVRTFDKAVFKCITINCVTKEDKLFITIIRRSDFITDPKTPNEWGLGKVDKQMLIDWDNFFENYEFSEKDCATMSGNNFTNNVIQANWQHIKKVFLQDFKDGSHGKSNQSK